MNAFKILYNEVVSFFSIGSIIEMVKSGDYSKLLTFDGILSVLYPLVPFWYSLKL